MKKSYAFLLWFYGILLCLIFLPLTVKASGDTITMHMAGQYQQTQARKMLDMVNEFRTGSDAWYWNQDNATKSVKTNLSPLVYDYELEKVAMKRAAELAVIYSHTRPNNRDCFSAIPSYYGWSAVGENIAYGFASAESVFSAWKEDDENYSGQGHRRNMLNENFNRVGFGCFVYGGRMFWVQEFARSQYPIASQAANDSQTTVDVELFRYNYNGSRICYGRYCDTDSSIEMYFDESIDCSQIFECISTVIMHDGQYSYGSFYYPNDNLSIADNTIATISDGKIVPLKAGTTQLNMTSVVDGQTLLLPIEIKSYDINDIFFYLYQTSYEYTGSPITPSLNIYYYPYKEVAENKDYTLSYENNIYPGKATVTITGIGAFAGSSCTLDFKIFNGDISDAVIKMDKEFTYTGKAIKPAVTLSYKGKTLSEKTDYTLSYVDNTKVGTGYVNITGAGPFEGSSFSESFQIVKSKDNTSTNKPKKKGSTFTYSFGTYKVTSSSAKNPTVTLVKVNTNPKNLTIPDKVYDNKKVAYKVTGISAGSCSGKKKLQSLTVGKNVTSVGKKAFYDCKKLCKITFNSPKAKIGSNSFKNIKSKATITVKTGKKADKKKFVTNINKTGGAKNGKLK